VKAYDNKMVQGVGSSVACNSNISTNVIVLAFMLPPQAELKRALSVSITHALYHKITTFH